MARLEPDEYLRLKGFLGAWDAKFLRSRFPDLPEEHRPIAALERTEKVSMARARAGLLMAVNDIVEMSLPWSPEQVVQTDREFGALGVLTLSEVRARYTRRLSRLVDRGSIRNDVEYYLAKGVLDGAPEALDGATQAKLAELVTAYEERRAAR
jgi:hypothetical protein